MARFRTLIAVSTLLVASSVQAAANGHVRCQVTENGKAAQGTLLLSQDGHEVARAACGSDALSVPAGEYVASIQLDGALDSPEARKPVTVNAGQTAQVSNDFATGTLEVRIQNDGRRAAGMAQILRNGGKVGTLGSGVSGHLSAGTYEVVARYRDNEQRVANVVVKAGENRVVNVAFGSASGK